MATEIPQTPPAAKRSISARTVIVVLFLAAALAFAVMNAQPVDVWLIRWMKMPLFLVIFLSVTMGVVVGWLTKSILAARYRRSLRDE